MTALQQCLPLTVLKLSRDCHTASFAPAKLQQCLPLTVLKRMEPLCAQCLHSGVATVLTVYGIETHLLVLRYRSHSIQLQQHLPFTVCAEGCEAAEKQSGNEGRTSQVPERSEGKTKVIKE